MPSPLRIFFVLNESGCAFWRGRLPAEAIRRQGLADVQVMSLASVSRDELDPILSWSNVVVTQTPAGPDAVVILAYYRKSGKKLVCDYDDLIFEASPFNPAYRTLGLKEVKVKDVHGQARWLWKDGVQGFSLVDNRVRFLSLQDLLHLSNVITVTTPYLKGRYQTMLEQSAHPGSSADWGQKIDILPNSVDFARWRAFDKRVRDHRRVRIGWTCSSSHLSELWMMRDIIRDVWAKHKDVVFVIMGDVSELAKIDGLPHDAIEFHEWTDLTMYPLKLASLELDIGICPLQQNSFNDCKSQLKWSEFAAFRLPCVVSKSPAYDCVIDGVDALVADADNERGDQEWVAQLGRLIEDRGLRRRLGEAAFERNYQEFNIEKNAVQWVKTYQSLM